MFRKFRENRFFFKLVLLAFFLKITVFSVSQDIPDYQWWADAHNWDGVTHWSRYIIRSPGYMGPNALPIPLVGKAVVGEKIQLETAIEYHKGRGEYAYNPYFNLIVPVAKNKAALNFIYRPFEYYQTQEFIRFERHGRNKECKGFAKGDLYIGTLVQILNEEKHFVDGVLEIFLKTTTGKDLANGRHIDAPAYYFDLNLGKSVFKNDGFLKDISFYSMLGFYVWQADFNNNRQNDAYLYGLRSDIEFKPLLLSLSYSGYSGYMNLRDKPMALRISLNKNFNKSRFYVSYQNGLRDVIKKSYRVGYEVSF